MIKTTGRVNPDHAPEVANAYSYTVDAQGHTTKTLIQQTFVLDAWALFARTLIGSTESWSFTTLNEATSIAADQHEDDANEFSIWNTGTVDSSQTLIYGDVFDKPVLSDGTTDINLFTLSFATAQSDGSKSISYLKTDYTGSYNLQPGQLEYVKAPVAQGWSRNFDGTALNSQDTRSGVTQSDIYQQFSDAIFVNTKGLTRLADTIQRTYSFFEDAQMASYSYDNPAPDFEGATNRSYTETLYQGTDDGVAWSSYDQNTGQVNRDHAPEVGESYSYSKDAQGHITKTLLNQQFLPEGWSLFARTLLNVSESWSFSAMDEIASATADAREDDAGKFTNWNGGNIDQAGTLIYGEDRQVPTFSDGTTDTDLFTLKNFATPQSDGSESISYLKTQYINSYDLEPDKLTYMSAPVTQGWARNLDGTTLNPDVTRTGVTQTDIYQESSDAIFDNTKGLTRLQETIQRSYSFVEDDNMSSYSYDNPAADFEGATNSAATPKRFIKEPAPTEIGRPMIKPRAKSTAIKRRKWEHPTVSATTDKGITRRRCSNNNFCSKRGRCSAAHC